MTLFKQRTMVDGSMPYTHIGEVVAVSFAGPEVRIKLISVYPAVELPVYYLPEGGSWGDPLISRETVEAYYCPAVPRDPFPFDYDPETDPYPEIPTQYISARYYVVGQKVVVIQDGQDFFVMSPIYPDEPQKRYNGIGFEQAHREWLSMLHKAVPVVRPVLKTGFLTADDKVFVTEDGIDYVGKERTPVTQMLFHNYNLYQSIHLAPELLINHRFPIFVFPRESLVHLQEAGWTWAGGAYNYAYIYSSFHRKESVENESFLSPSVLFPTKNPDVRLEIQGATQAETGWVDELPDLEFYLTASDIGDIGIEHRDFINNDDHVQFIFSITRPWGTVSGNNQEWRTSNWVPPILFSPDDTFSKNTKTTGKINFGFIDYKKNNYDLEGKSEIYWRPRRHNEYSIITGWVSVLQIEDTVGKPMLRIDDFEYSYDYTTVSVDSGYTLHIEDTIVPDDGSTIYTRIVTMNQPAETEEEEDEPLQLFTVCTDGVNYLKKKPILKHIDQKVRSSSGQTEYVEIVLAIEHYINDILMFTTEFRFKDDRTVVYQRLYYLFCIDLHNKKMLAHVYIYDQPGDLQRIEAVVIDNGDEYVIWTYDVTPVTSPIPRNVPPWLLNIVMDFPDHPSDTLTDASFDHVEYIWKVPYYDNLGFQINTDEDSDCTVRQDIVAVSRGLYYPCTEHDEDIRSVILFNTVHYSPEEDVQGYTQQKQHNLLSIREYGWVAYMRCCMSVTEGIIDYPYGSDMIKKDMFGSITDASEIYSGDAEIIKTYIPRNLQK